MTEPFSLVKAQAVIQSRRLGNKSKKSKSKPTAATVVVRGEDIKQIVSRYTGLPKGPSGVEEQDKLLRQWAKDNYAFPKSKEIKRLITSLKKNKNFVVPTSVRQVKRRAAVINAMKKVSIELVDDDIVALALGKGKFRKAYWICCSLYGNTQRELHGARKKHLVVEDPDDSEAVRVLKEKLREVDAASASAQREWQRRMSAFKEANKDLLDVVNGLAVVAEEIRDELKHSPQPAPTPSLTDEQSEGIGSGDEDESDEENDESSSSSVQSA